MSNETCTVTIADIYGADWWERNKEELDREWEYELGVATEGQEFVCLGSGQGINSARCSSPRYEVRIILHRRKPKVPTLREVYGVEEATIQQGWEWTGEFRIATEKDTFLGHCGSTYTNYGSTGPVLILRKRQPKVWFKAEEKARLPISDDWYWDSQWVLSRGSFREMQFLCATRHEAWPPQQVVTQAMVDEVVGR